MVTANFLSTAHVGRFGWKHDHVFLLEFSGDAYLNEMGITNRDNSVDTNSCALGVSQFGVTLEDTASKILWDRTAAPTSTGSRTSCAYSRLRRCFRRLRLPGRAWSYSPVRMRGFPHYEPDHRFQPRIIHPHIHRRNADELEGHKALAKQTFDPYSDFLLHSMGSLGDRITSGSAGPMMIGRRPCGASRQIHRPARRPRGRCSYGNFTARRPGQSSGPGVPRALGFAAGRLGEFPRHAVIGGEVARVQDIIKCRLNF
jgi:hypothetical protein